MIYGINGNSLNSAYELDGDAIGSAYDIDGDIAWTSRPPHAVSNNFTTSLIVDVPEIGSGTQGLACDSLSQTINQLYSGGVNTIDISDGSYVGHGLINLGHGSAGQFEPTKLNPSDPFPTLWVSTGETQTINDVVYGRYLEVYLGATTSTLNRAFFTPLEQSGESLYAFDFANRIVYEIWFSSYSDSTGTGKVKAYDMDDVTEFTEGSYGWTPANGNWIVGQPIDEFAIDYVRECQSVTFFDGLLCFLSDQPRSNGRVVFVDTELHDVYLTITPLVIPFEREGIDFILNPNTNKYDMVVSARYTGANVYYRYQFS